MTNGTASAEKVADYAERLLRIILSKGNTLPRTYGFEYEFLPTRILQQADMILLDSTLRSWGYVPEGGTYSCGGKQVVFEPGGQIEYLSPPLKGDDDAEVRGLLEWIGRTNRDILTCTGIEYIGTDYMPDRYDAPLLLSSPRYSMMHERFRKVDRRGPEMMKGTAAIHMHAAIVSEKDLESLFRIFSGMARSRILGMSSNRREIWDMTDSCRCGMVLAEEDSDAQTILQRIVEHAMNAVEFRTGEIFRSLDHMGFDDFLQHLTTIFTDIRINVKGGTMELRTPDSRPVSDFPPAWNEFVRQCEELKG